MLEVFRIQFVAQLSKIMSDWGVAWRRLVARLSAEKLLATGFRPWRVRGHYIPLAICGCHRGGRDTAACPYAAICSERSTPKAQLPVRTLAATTARPRSVEANGISTLQTEPLKLPDSALSRSSGMP